MTDASREQERSPLAREPVEATPRKTMTTPHREAILMRQDGRCGGCMADVGWLALRFEVDHVIPLWFNGADEDFNLVALCVPCHKLKTAKDRAAIAKAKRLQRDADPFTRRRSPHRLRSRGFKKADPLKIEDRGADGHD